MVNIKEREYILIDNKEYLEYFMKTLKNDYIPITTDIYVKSFLQASNIKTIEISEYLSPIEIKQIYLDTSRMVDSFLDETRNCLEDKSDKKDLERREFLEKYCTYKGDPEDNIIRSIGIF